MKVRTWDKVAGEMVVVDSSEVEGLARLSQNQLELGLRFVAILCGTQDDPNRSVFGSGKLPGAVLVDSLIEDLDEIKEWIEDGAEVPSL